MSDIFYNFNNINLQMLAHHKHHILYENPLLIGGFYNWPKVFYRPNNFTLWDDATIPRRVKEEDINVLLAVLSRPENLSFMGDSMQRQKLPYGYMAGKIEHPSLTVENMEGLHNTAKDIKKMFGIQVVGGLDYAVEMWSQIDVFNNRLLAKNLQAYNKVFVAEPAQGHLVYQLLDRKKDIYFLPHPTNTMALKYETKDINTKAKTIRTLVHRYDLQWAVPEMVAKEAPKRGYENIAVTLEGHEQFVTQLQSNGLTVESGKAHTEWVKILANTFAIVDSYHGVHSYGRSVVESACCRTPHIGSDVTYMQKHLFPELTTKPYDVVHQADLLNRLISDPKFYKGCVDYAYEAVEAVNYDNCATYFCKMLNNDCKKMSDTWRENKIDAYLMFKGEE